MYTAKTTVDRIQEMLKSKKLVQKSILKKCGISENILNQMTDNKGISSFYLAKISDELDCSVDYLLGRTENPQSHKISNSVTTGDISLSNNSVVGDGQVGVTIHNGIPQNGQDEFLLEIFNSLDWIKRSKLLIYADELRKSE